MANKLPEEKELLEQLRREKAAVPGDMWHVIYTGIEDSLLVIKLIIDLYREQKKDIPPEEAKKILTNIRDVSSVFRQLINPQVVKTQDKGLVKIKTQGGGLHPIVRDMVNHYIGNDIQAMNFIIGDTIDDGLGLNLGLQEKIMGHIADMEEFLGKLKMNTETTGERVRARLTAPMVYLRSLRESLDGPDKDKVDKCLASLEEISGMLGKEN